MELFTRSFVHPVERIVHLHAEKCAGIPKQINDDGLYKILLVEEGSVNLKTTKGQKLLTAPALLLLTEEKAEFTDERDLLTTTVYFKPTEIREEFTFERLHSGEFEQSRGKTIYQDYLLVSMFEKSEDGAYFVAALDLPAFEKIKKIAGQITEQLKKQPDGYWPCRSRSFLMELLYFIGYIPVDCPKVVCAETTETGADSVVGEIIRYMSEHISETITQEDLTRKFFVNRNRLNELFVKETSMTAMNYLTRMRINLAQIMLADTEISIAEISLRVGFEDANYFGKVFKKHTGVTPTKYRDSFYT